MYNEFCTKDFIHFEIHFNSKVQQEFKRYRQKNE